MNPRHILPAVLCFLVSLLLAACESRPDRHAMMEEARHSVPPMAAKESFFDGGVIAYLTLGNDSGAGRLAGDNDNSGHGAGAGGGGGGGRHGGGGGRRGGAGGGGGQSGGEGAPSSSMRSSNMPPAMLRLRLENTSAAAIDLEVRELNSELGDFAVRPDKLTLQPGQATEVDPMESLLGLDTYSLPVTITLRSGARTETKVLTLQLVKPASDVAPTTATPAPPATTPTTSGS